MDDVKPHNSENSAYFRVRVYRGTCYGSPALTIEIHFGAGEKIACEFSEGLKKKSVSLERVEADFFLLKIFEIIEKEEILSGLRHVDVRYHAEIEWYNLEFVKAEKSGEFKAFSDEWFADEIEIFLEQEAETPETAEQFQKILDKNLHRHALEIYRTVKDFSRKYLMLADSFL